MIELLAEQGYEADLDIISMRRDGATVGNLKLRSDGEPLLQIEDLRLGYQWPDIREGKIDQINLKGVKLHLDLNEDWSPKNDRLKALFEPGETSENETDVRFPQDGIKIEDGEVFIKSPLGKTDIYFDGEILSPDRFKASLSLAPSEMNYRGFMANGAGILEIEKNQEGFDLDGQFQSDRLANGSVSIADASTAFSGQIDPDTFFYQGKLSIQGGRIESEPFTAEAVNFSWDGDISPTGEKSANGTWHIKANTLALPMKDRQEAVADTLSLYPALSVIPVSEHYADPLKQALKGFFSGTDMTAKGHFDYGSDGFSITAHDTVSFVSGDNSLILTPDPEAPIYEFDRATQTLKARMDAKFENPVGLTLNNIILQANTPNGYQLDGVTGFAADIKTNRPWTVAAIEDQRPVRLGPLSSRIDYQNNGETVRHVSIKTALDYDGPVPGGRIEKLNMSGEIGVQLFENRQVLDFKPDPGTVVQFDQLETPTDWTINQARIDLPDTKKIFVKTPELSNFNGDLTRAEFILKKPALDDVPAQEVSLAVGATDYMGRLRPDRSQDWTVGLRDVIYQSDTMPQAGTTGRAEQAELFVKMAVDQSPQFKLTSPAIFGSTDLAEINNMAINLAGTADNYAVDHSGGTVKLAGSELSELLAAEGFAVFPANGQFRFENEEFIGTTGLKIAKADNAAVNIDYRYAGGVGSADIDIPSVKFDPNGLQPQTLLPTLRGKIALVTGEARARFKIGFADGALTRSSGQLEVIDMDAGTAPGPLEGMNTSIEFSSLWPVETKGVQTLTMKSFNPGYALKDGVMTYQLLPDGIAVQSAKWPIGAGFLSLDPFQWIYTAEENHVVMLVENISLGDFLTQLESDKLQATGTVTGQFPITVRGVQVFVEEGKISIPDGGTIQYESGLPGRSYTQEEALAVFREKRTNEYAAVARDALKAFNYKSLSLAMDGPLDGRIEIGMVFDGSNPKILNSQPFRFHLNVGGKLLSILQSFNSNAQIKSEILNQTGLDIDNVSADP